MSFKIPPCAEGLFNSAPNLADLPFGECDCKIPAVNTLEDSSVQTYAGYNVCPYSAGEIGVFIIDEVKDLYSEIFTVYSGCTATPTCDDSEYAGPEFIVQETEDCGKRFIKAYVTKFFEDTPDPTAGFPVSGTPAIVVVKTLNILDALAYSKTIGIEDEIRDYIANRQGQSKVQIAAAFPIHKNWTFKANVVLNNAIYTGTAGAIVRVKNKDGLSFNICSPVVLSGKNCVYSNEAGLATFDTAVGVWTFEPLDIEYCFSANITNPGACGYPIPPGTTFTVQRSSDGRLFNITHNQVIRNVPLFMRVCVADCIYEVLISETQPCKNLYLQGNSKTASFIDTDTDISVSEYPSSFIECHGGVSSPLVFTINTGNFVICNTQIAVVNACNYGGTWAINSVSTEPEVPEICDSYEVYPKITNFFPIRNPLVSEPENRFDVSTKKQEFQPVVAEADDCTDTTEIPNPKPDDFWVACAYPKCVDKASIANGCPQDVQISRNDRSRLFAITDKMTITRKLTNDNLYPEPEDYEDWIVKVDPNNVRYAKAQWNLTSLDSLYDYDPTVEVTTTLLSNITTEQKQVGFLYDADKNPASNTPETDKINPMEVILLWDKNNPPTRFGDDAFYTVKHLGSLDGGGPAEHFFVVTGDDSGAEAVGYKDGVEVTGSEVLFTGKPVDLEDNIIQTNGVDNVLLWDIHPRWKHVGGSSNWLRAFKKSDESENGSAGTVIPWPCDLEMTTEWTDNPIIFEDKAHPLDATAATYVYVKE